MNKSILSMNGFGLDEAHLPANWLYRLEELERADARTLKSKARHHLTLAVAESLVCVRIALDEYLELLAVPKRERWEGWSPRVRACAKSIFHGFTLMDRVAPGIEALRKLNRGEVPVELGRLLQAVWALLASADEIRQHYYRMPASERVTKVPADRVAKIYVELQCVLQKLLADARAAFDLDSIDAEAAHV